MELRKREGQGEEFEILHSKLEDLGLYEKGMDLDQMRQVMGAVDESINETSFSERDIEYAIRESEREFCAANICNSTMIGLEQTNSQLDSSLYGHRNRNFNTFSSPYSSPEISCIQKMTVVAEIHHELEWTPKKQAQVPQVEEQTKDAQMQIKPTSDAKPPDDSGVILSSNSVFETTSF